jgi:hypothetical protein
MSPPWTAPAIDRGNQSYSWRTQSWEARSVAKSGDATRTITCATPRCGTLLVLLGAGAKATGPAGFTDAEAAAIGLDEAAEQRQLPELGNA